MLRSRYYPIDKIQATRDLKEAWREYRGHLRSWLDADAVCKKFWYPIIHIAQDNVIERIRWVRNWDDREYEETTPDIKKDLNGNYKILYRIVKY